MHPANRPKHVPAKTQHCQQPVCDELGQCIWTSTEDLGDRWAYYIESVPNRFYVRRMTDWHDTVRKIKAYLKTRKKRK